MYIQVEKGVVTVTGAARNLAAKEAAEEDAWNTPGVVEEVKNLITVQSCVMHNDRELAT